MTITDFKVPENTCVYEEYDSTSLNPTNQCTCVRLNELDWSNEQFQDKTVLDIGCNLGILSLYASKLGATSVHAVDVQQPFVDFLDSVVSNHELSINVDKINFQELSGSSHSADIVLFMNVLHWIVDQKGNVPDAIYKLATLTNETLYIETPWDSNEPSIANNPSITPDNYNVELIFQELQRYFEKVRILRFMTYFENMEGSKRILIKASGKRNDIESYRILDRIRPLNISLSRGSNSVQLMSSPEGPVVLKKLPAESMLPLLDPSLANQLFDHLKDDDGPLLPAIRINNDYIVKNSLNEHLMLSPFVGNLADHLLGHTAHAPVENPLKLAVECRRSFIKVPQKVIDSVKEKSPPVTLKKIVDLGEYFNQLLDTNGLSNFTKQVFETSKTPDRSWEDSIIHNDLQLGNMITDKKGKNWILDLDILRSGSAYSDFICCAIYNNTPKAVVLELYNEIREINGRSIEIEDLLFASNFIFKWICELNKNYKPALMHMGEPTVSGMKTMHDLVLSEKSKYQAAS